MAIPKALRPDGLRTKVAVAKLLKVRPNIIYWWQTLPGWWDEVYKYARLQIGEDLGAILQAMVREAVGGDMRAAKLCLEALGVHADRLILQGTITHDNLVIILDEQDGAIDANTIDGQVRRVKALRSSIDTSDEEVAEADEEIIVFEELFAGPPEGDPEMRI